MIRIIGKVDLRPVVYAIRFSVSLALQCACQGFDYFCIFRHIRASFLESLIITRSRGGILFTHAAHYNIRKNGMTNFKVTSLTFKHLSSLPLNCLTNLLQALFR